MRAVCEHDIGGEQQDEPGHHQRSVARRVGELAERVGRQCIHDVHRHHHERHEREHAAAHRAQHQERFAEAGQREHGADGDDPPVARAELRDDIAADRVDARGARAGSSIPNASNATASTPNHGQPECEAEIVVPPQHDDDGQKRPEERAHRIERLTQPVGGTTQVDGVTSATSASRGARTADSLPIRSTIRAVTTTPSVGAIANSGLLSAPVSYPATASHLRLRRSLSVPENTLTTGAVASAIPSMTPIAVALAPARHQEHRQQAVDDFRRHVHQQADAAQHPDTARNLAKNAGRRFGLHGSLRFRHPDTGCR